MTLTQKFDFLSDGKTLNRHAYLKQRQLDRLCELQGLEQYRLDWAEVLTVYKETGRERFDEIMMQELLYQKRES